MNSTLFSRVENYSVHYNASENSPFLAFENDDCHLPLAVIFTLALAYGAVIILGVSGNLALIIIILKQKEMRNVTNILIVNLSFSDLLVAVMCLPFTFVHTDGPLGLRGDHVQTESFCAMRLHYSIHFLSGSHRCGTSSANHKPKRVETKQ